MSLYAIYVKKHFLKKSKSSLSQFSFKSSKANNTNVVNFNRRFCLHIMMHVLINSIVSIEICTNLTPIMEFKHSNKFSCARHFYFLTKISRAMQVAKKILSSKINKHNYITNCIIVVYANDTHTSLRILKYNILVFLLFF